MLSVGAGQSLVFVSVPIMARELGLSEQNVGTIFASSAIFWMLTSRYWGGLTDRFGRRWILVIGLCGYALSLGSFALMLRLGQIGLIAVSLVFPLLIITRCLNGLFGSATRPGRLCHHCRSDQHANSSQGHGLCRVWDYLWRGGGASPRSAQSH